MASNETTTDDERSSSQWFKHNLTALGSAAVLAVYAAGYWRTRAAAAAFEAQDEARKLAVAQRAARTVESPTRVAATTDTVTKPLGTPNTDSSSAAAPHVGTATSPSRAGKSAVASTATPSRPVASKPTPSKPAQSKPAPPARVVVDSAIRDSIKAAIVVDTAATRTASDSSGGGNGASKKLDFGYRDGHYVGYGTSREGDIEVIVEVKNRRIVSTTISQCLTRYPCSWVEKLPDQVIERQSSDVDFVSGATESSNAFILAVGDALSKAQ